MCLHNGSSSWTAARSPGAPLELYTSLFPVNALVTAADWLWAQVPTRFPGIKIAFSEGGISWVPMLIDRIDYVLDALGGRFARLGRHRRSRRPRRCAATSGSAPSTSARRSRCATTSASTTSVSRATTRTPTPPGPTRNRARAAALADVAPDVVRKVTWENASQALPPPGARTSYNSPRIRHLISKEH